MKTADETFAQGVRAAGYRPTHQFTVILRKPDYITTDDAERYVVHHVEASDVAHAVEAARVLAAAVEFGTPGVNNLEAHDYLPLFIFEGRPKLAALGFNL